MYSPVGVRRSSKKVGCRGGLARSSVWVRRENDYKAKFQRLRGWRTDGAEGKRLLLVGLLPSAPYGSEMRPAGTRDVQAYTHDLARTSGLWCMGIPRELAMMGTPTDNWPVFTAI